MAETTNTIPDYPRGITFEQVWAALMEDREQLRKYREENDRQSKETDRRLKETERLINENSKLIGGLGNSIGGLIETLVAARLWEKFQGYPYGFTRVFRRMPIYEPGTTRPLTEIDILLSDTEWVMAVEVKRDMVIKDVEHHIVRMKRIKENLPAEAVGKKFLAAFACGTITNEARDAAFASGFFVLELKGESVELLQPPNDFNPKEW